MTKMTLEDQHAVASDPLYAKYLKTQHSHASASDIRPVFRTNADPAALWAAYLSVFPTAEAAQHHNCNACRHFVERYAGLVWVNTDGSTQSATMTPNAEGVYGQAHAAVWKLVNKAKITGVFITEAKILGTPEAGGFGHMAAMPTQGMRVPKTWMKSGDGYEGNLKTQFASVCKASHEFKLKTVATAVEMLESETVWRAEKVIGPARWLQEFQNMRHDSVSSKVQNNLSWLMVASAPEGFLHPRTSMIGTLLEDLEAGKPLSDVRKSFSAKVNPIKYQRPTAAPKEGAIKLAESLVAKLGIQKSLERRFARTDEMPHLWRTPLEPAEDTQSQTGGVFAHLSKKKDESLPAEDHVTTISMSWGKFQSTILPKARKLEVHANGGNQAWSAYTTAAHADAPPILAWDSEDARWPFSGYVYHGGSPAQNWNIKPGFRECTHMILAYPEDRVPSNHSQNLLFVVADCRDLVSQRPGSGTGNALFPETLRPELHEVRPVIEAYSKSAMISGIEQGDAQGLRISKGSCNLTLRVTTEHTVTLYKIDRWE